MYEKILLPSGGSKPALRATEHAMWTALQSNAELIILHVIDMSLFPRLPAEDSIKMVK